MISEWRQGVADYLAGQFTDATVLSGSQDGVVRDVDTVIVFWPGWDVLQRDIALAAPTLTVRYFPARSKQPSATIPPDPSPIEAAADALRSAFDRASQGVGFFTADLSCRLSSIRPNYDPAVWRVEATLVAYTLSEAA